MQVSAVRQTYTEMESVAELQRERANVEMILAHQSPRNSSAPTRRRLRREPAMRHRGCDISNGCYPTSAAYRNRGLRCLNSVKTRMERRSMEHRHARPCV